MPPLFATSLQTNELKKADSTRITAKASKRATIEAEKRSIKRDDATMRKIEAAGARIGAREEA